MRILIALDESPVSSRAARVAASLFGLIPGAEFLVVNVARVPASWVGAAGFGEVMPLDVDPRWLQGDVDNHADEERELMTLAASAGIRDPEVILTAGDPVERICAVADEHDVAAIVVGSHHKTALRRLFDPSVAAGVVRATHRPVLVVSGRAPAGD